MGNIIKEVLIATEEASGQRLDKYLSEKPGILSRSKATALITAGLVTVNGRTLKPSAVISNGDKIEYCLPELAPSGLQPLDLKLDVVYEDSAVIVINKPSGLVVHPAAGHRQDTLVNALLHHTDDLSAGFDEQRPGIVHRLDKDTSGLLVVAKTEKAQVSLANQFKERTTKRVYQAVVFGVPKNQSGRIESFLGRNENERKRFSSVTRGGKKAITNYRVLSHGNGSDTSLMELVLETGRTHQIRIHLSELGHPIIGDWLYGRRARIKGLKSVSTRELVEALPRFLLHAQQLAFLHPDTELPMSFEVGWPKDMFPLLAEMGYPQET